MGFRSYCCTCICSIEFVASSAGDGIYCTDMGIKLWACQIEIWSRWLFWSCFTIDIYLEKIFWQNYLEQMTVKEVAAVAIWLLHLCLVIWAFKWKCTFASRENVQIFFYQNTDRFWRVAILHAIRAGSVSMLLRRTSVMNVMLKSQYDQCQIIRTAWISQMKYRSETPDNDLKGTR